MLLRFASHETKNRSELHYELRPATLALLDLYVSSARSLLCGVPSTLLFPGRGGKPKTHGAIGNQISKTVYKEVGIRMTPHQFRHAIGKIILDQMPGALSLVSDLLGHKSTETARKFYGGLDQVRAAKSYDKLLSRLRGGDSGEGGNVGMAPPSCPVDPARRSMPVTEWPERDRMLWQQALRPPQDVLDEGGRAAAWAQRTRDNVQAGVGASSPGCSAPAA